ncbi:MAG: hypothetical protein PHF57_05970 [Methanoregula sp.]|nr:hypothetical protein [Methanoregula sp.]
MNEDAVAPVVAVMLILAIGVTFFAAWNAYYVPSMKAQSEITHLKDVETGFLRFSSDIETAASLKKTVRLSEPIPLGGGEFTFNAVKSGGLLRIQNESEGYMRISIINGTTPVTTSNLLRFSNYSFQPVNNFWQDQGYVWSFGNVNVTKGSLSTPLLYTSMDTVTYRMTRSLFDLDMVPSRDDPAVCSLMNVYIVNMTPAAGHTTSSGNGNGMLVLESTVTNQQFTNATSMTLRINPGIPEGFRSALWNSVNLRVNESLSCRNVHAVSNSSNLEIQMMFDTIPNMTLNRKTIEIVLGTD